MSVTIVELDKENIILARERLTIFSTYTHVYLLFINNRDKLNDVKQQIISQFDFE